MLLTDAERQFLNRAKQFLKDQKALLSSVAFYGFVTVNDWISSLLARRNPDLQEQNPFSRDAQMHFVLHKAVVVDALFFTALCLVAYTVYQALKDWNRLVAKAVSCGLFIYISYDRLMEAVVPNYLLDLHFFVPDKDNLSNLVRKLFGA